MDLCPYICVANECLDPVQIYQSRQQWLSHMQDRHFMRWRCVRRPHKCPIVFEDENAFIKHIKTEHPGQVADDQLQRIAEYSAKPKSPIFDACPFCNEHQDDYENHVAQHLQEFALKHLPWPDEYELDSATSDKESLWMDPASQHTVMDWSSDTSGVSIPPSYDLPASPDDVYSSSVLLSDKLAEWHRPLTVEQMRNDPILTRIAQMQQLDEVRDDGSERTPDVARHEVSRLVQYEQKHAPPVGEDLAATPILPPLTFSAEPDHATEGEQWARRVEEAWQPCILTLDGGGIRNYSSLLMLKALMHEVWIWEKRLEAEDPIGQQQVPEDELLPCHYFDFMYGTSGGGLIATLLGRLRMTVSGSLDLFRQISDDVYGHRRTTIPFMKKYDTKPIERAMQAVIGSRCQTHTNCDGSKDLHPWFAQFGPSFDVDVPRPCQSRCLVATRDRTSTATYLLRTYEHSYTDTIPVWIERFNEGADEMSIREVVCATMADPSHFSPFRAYSPSAGRMMDFMDGGLCENNPSRVAYSEFQNLYEGRAEHPALLLSIGAGRPDEAPMAFQTSVARTFDVGRSFASSLEYVGMRSGATIQYKNGQAQHQAMRHHAHGEHTWYKRVDVSGLLGIAPDEWVQGDWNGQEDLPGGETLARMDWLTREELKRGFSRDQDDYAAPSIALVHIAEKMVRQKRARQIEGGSRWEVFASAKFA